MLVGGHFIFSLYQLAYRGKGTTKVVPQVGFEPTQPEAADLQSAETLPRSRYGIEFWHTVWGSNPSLQLEGLLTSPEVERCINFGLHGRI